MFFSPFIALRYLKPKRTFVSIITVISVLGVTLGVWLLTVVIAVFSGYGKIMKENILGFQPHLEVRGDGYIHDFRPLLEKIKTVPGVKSATPYVMGSVIMEYNGMRNAPVIRAIFPPEEDSEEYHRLSTKLAKVPNPEHLDDPSQPELIPVGKFYLDPYSAVMGDAMAKELGVEIGSKVLLYSPRDVESMMGMFDDLKSEDPAIRDNAMNKLKERTIPQEVTITGIFDSGNMDFDANFIFLDLETGQVLYNFDLQEAHHIEIRLDDAFHAEKYKDLLLVALGLGEKRKVDSSPSYMASQFFLKGPGLVLVWVCVGLTALVGLLGYFFLRRNRFQPLAVTGGITAAFLGLQWVMGLIKASGNQYFVEQSSGEPFRLLTWMQIHATIFNAIAAERQAMYIILFMIMIVGAFCIMNTMITVTYQKRSEIGLMKALGARESQIAWLFLIQGMVVGLVGVGVGMIVAQTTIWNRNHIADWVGRTWGVDIFSSDIYRIEGGLPAYLVPGDYLTIGAGAFLACTIAALVPAVLAAKLQPAKALRSE